MSSKRGQRKSRIDAFNQAASVTVGTAWEYPLVTHPRLLEDPSQILKKVPFVAIGVRVHLPASPKFDLLFVCFRCDRRNANLSQFLPIAATKVPIPGA
jgi:hypothetical protein